MSPEATRAGRTARVAVTLPASPRDGMLMGMGGARGNAPGKGLTRERICTAALAIIDDEGLPALNMRRLGASLGVDAMALYRHLPNKQAILDGVIDLVLDELDEGRGEDPGARALTFFSSLRSALAAHPNAIPLVASSGLQTGAARQKATGVLDALRSSGLDGERAADVFATLESLTLGYAWLEVSGFVGELPESEPFLRRYVPPPALSPATSGDRFDRSLRAVLEALLGR